MENNYDYVAIVNGAKLLAPDGSFTNLSIADPIEDEHAATKNMLLVLLKQRQLLLKKEVFRVEVH